MARPSKCRRICSLPQSKGFEPIIKPSFSHETVIMTVDEYETIRLIDLEGFTQEQCAMQMEIARTTVTGIYDTARKKIADAIVHGYRLMIQGGHYQLCNGSKGHCCSHTCPKYRCHEGRFDHETCSNV